MPIRVGADGAYDLRTILHITYWNAANKRQCIAMVSNRRTEYSCIYPAYNTNMENVL